jgi:hypothetical protein
MNEELTALNHAVGSDRLYIFADYDHVMQHDGLPPYRTLPFYDPLLPARSWLVGSAMGALAEYQYYLIPPVPHTRFFDWASVQSLVTWTVVEDAQRHGWRPNHLLSSGAVVYENVRVVPRASLWENYVVVPDAVALEYLTTARPISENVGIALEDTPTAAWTRAPRQPAATGPRQILLRSDESDRVLLEVRADRPLLLLLSDAYDPGWKCTVDGQPTRILRANYLFRAVELLPGPHTVEFRYWPRGLNAGLAVSSCAILLLALLPVVAPKRISFDAAVSHQQKLDRAKTPGH